MERKIAEIALRAYGGIIDLMIIILLPIFTLAFLSFDQLEGNTTRIIQIVMSTSLYLTFIISEGLTGKTPGKYFAETRVVKRNGEFIGIGQSVVRNLIRVVDFIGFYLVGWITMLLTEHNQRIGDLVAGTLVVYEGQDPDYDEDNVLPVIIVNYPANKTENTA